MVSDNTSPTLVIMAAGRGARYGGAKQIDSVGPSGETLLDYAIFDARRAGFSRIVIVTRRDLLPELEAHIQRCPPDLDVRCAVQIPPFVAGEAVSRTRPWGTVHAVLSAVDREGQAVVALNADDFYGRAAYEIARTSIDWAAATGEASVVAMRLDATLSEHGPVVRAVCRVDGDQLTGLEEVRGLARTASGLVGQGGDGRPITLRGDELVSMNMWVLPAALVRALGTLFNRFVAAHAQDADAELPLPEAVGALVASGTAKVCVASSEGPWFGLTHAQDRESVVLKLQQLTDAGVYPSPLWT